MGLEYFLQKISACSTGRIEIWSKLFELDSKMLIEKQYSKRPPVAVHH